LAGFDRKAWTITATGENPAPFVTLSYVSADGEEGYPGQLKTDITYRISGGTELSMEMVAVTDKPTIINLTNHSFFNLAGAETEGSILDHRLTIAADSYLPVSPAGIPLGALQQVDATPFDFRTAHPVGARMRDADQQVQIRHGYDHNYCLPGGATSSPRFAARVEDPGSGRVLELWTNQPGVQFYSGNFLDGTVTGAAGLSEYAEPSGLSVRAARSRADLSSRFALSIFRELKAGISRGRSRYQNLERAALPSR
jgi:aldose 1-epimerase